MDWALAEHIEIVLGSKFLAHLDRNVAAELDGQAEGEQQALGSACALGAVVSVGCSGEVLR